MTDTLQSNPAYPVPFRSKIMPVRDEWIDFNGHMNVAYYLVLFDECVDAVFIELELGPDYLKQTNASFFTVEVHINYLRELAPGAPTYLTMQFLSVDDKRVRTYLELFHAEEGFLAASCEQMFLHVDMGIRRASPFPAYVQERFAGVVEAHNALPWPERAGRSISMKRQTPATEGKSQNK